MSVIKKWFLVFAVVISAAKVWGQAAPSPFTTYGVGEPYGNGLVHNQGNGLGVSQPQYWYINNQNPALLIYNNYSVFPGWNFGRIAKDQRRYHEREEYRRKLKLHRNGVSHEGEQVDLFAGFDALYRRKF
jgi:hypothetical protein